MKQYKVLWFSLVLQSASLHADTGPYSAMIQKLTRIAQKENISALVVLVTDDNQTRLSKAIGSPSHDSKEQLTLHHYIRIGSISKMFTGLALIQLEKNHQIDLDTPIKNLVDKPPFDNRWEHDHPVRLAHLLEHTAGITDMSAREFKHNVAVSLTHAFNINPLARQLRWRPGYHSSYSNTGAGIAAYVIEQSSGMVFEDFVDREVFIPMGLDSATYIPTTEVLAKLVTGYDADGETKIPYWHTLYRAFGGINIRPIELPRVIRMYLNKGIIDDKRVFGRKSIKRMETPETTLAARSGLEYGYGLGLYHFVDNGIEFIGHGGDADGYLSYLAYSRSLNLGYFVSINAYNNQAMRDIRNIIQGKLIQVAGSYPNTGQPSIYLLQEEEIRRITGIYEPATYRFGNKPPDKNIEVIEEKGELFTLYGGGRKKLIAVSPNHFRRSGDPIATIAIIAEDGELYFQGDAGNFRKKVNPVEADQ